VDVFEVVFWVVNFEVVLIEDEVVVDRGVQVAVGIVHLEL